MNKDFIITIIMILTSTGIFANSVSFPSVRPIHILSGIEIMLAIGVFCRSIHIGILLIIQQVKYGSLNGNISILYYIVLANIAISASMAILAFLWTFRNHGQLIPVWEDYSWSIIEIFGLTIYHAMLSYIKIKECQVTKSWLGKYLIDLKICSKEDIAKCLQKQKEDRKNEQQR